MSALYMAASGGGYTSGGVVIVLYWLMEGSQLSNLDSDAQCTYLLLRVNVNIHLEVIYMTGTSFRKGTWQVLMLPAMP